MAGTEIELMPNEHMVLASNPHWFYFWKQVLGGSIFLVLLILLAWINVSWLDTVLTWLVVASVVVLVLMTLYDFVQWKTTKFAITDQRVAYQSGIIRRRGVSIPLNRINNVNFHQGLIARMFNNGVVTIESAGETGDSVFENIPDPEGVRSLIFGQIEADEQRDSDRDAAALAKAMREQMPQSPTTPTAPTAGTAGTVPERLAQLDALRAEGHISDAEYDAKRRQILDQL
jgi:uncharacterized membrane protein YdbT with pleckstrin-like domain